MAFLQSNFGSYKVMAFDTTSTKISDDQNERSNISIPKKEIVTQFIDNMVANLQCLREKANSSILLLPGFCRLHKVSHSEFECSSYQEVVAKVLMKMMGVKGGDVPKDEPMKNLSPINISKSIEKGEEEIEK